MKGVSAFNVGGSELDKEWREEKGKKIYRDHYK